MSWYNSNESTNPHILWSRVRYMRSLSALPFSRSQSDETEREYEARDEELERIMNANGFHKHMLSKSGDVDALSLLEKQFVNAAFARSDAERALYFNEPCSLAIFTGAECYVTIQALLGGAALFEAHKIASEAEEMLDREFSFAYSDKLGYLCSDIALCGSGIELSCALYLPSARHGSRSQEIRNLTDAFGASISPFFSRYDNAGDIYVVTYRPPFACNELDEVTAFSRFIDRLVEKERVQARIIFASKSTLIIDKAYRALGTLASARMIDEEEMASLLSRIRLALCLDDTNHDAPINDVSFINTLFSESLNASVISGAGGVCSSFDECRALRAKRINALCREKLLNP